MGREYYSRPINTGYSYADGSSTGSYPAAYVGTWMEYKVEQSAADILANQSKIHVKLYSQILDGGATSGMANYNGVAYNGATVGWDNANVTNIQVSAYNYNNKNLNTFVDTTITVPHNSDGTKTITLQTTFTTRSSTITGGSVSKSITLPTIARKTEISSVNGRKFGYATNVILNRKASNLRELVTLSIGSQTLKTTSDANADFSFTLARSYCPANAKTITGTMTVETFNGTTSLGSVSQSVTFDIDSSDTSFKPTLANDPTCQAYNDLVPSLSTDCAVATKSKLNVQAAKADVSTKYSATIASRTVTFSDGSSVSTDTTDHVSDRINTAGDVTWRYVVTDSRGFTVEKSGTFNVKANVTPSIVIAELYRGDSTEAKVDGGDHIYITASASCESYGGHNSVTLTAQVGSETPVTLTNGVRTAIKTNAVATDIYTVTISATDLLSTFTITQSLNGTDTPVSIRKGGHGVGIGRKADRADAMLVGYDAYFYETVKKVEGVNEYNICSDKVETTEITSLQNGASPYSLNNFGGCYYEICNNLCHLHMGVSGLTANTYTLVYSFPSGIAPASLSVNCGFGSQVAHNAKIVVSTGGDVALLSDDAYCCCDIWFFIA